MIVPSLCIWPLVKIVTFFISCLWEFGFVIESFEDTSEVVRWKFVEDTYWNGKGMVQGCLNVNEDLKKVDMTSYEEVQILEEFQEIKICSRKVSSCMTAFSNWMECGQNYCRDSSSSKMTCKFTCALGIGF